MFGMRHQVDEVRHRPPIVAGIGLESGRRKRALEMAKRAAAGPRDLPGRATDAEL
jgi:hypothetical protein